MTLSSHSRPLDDGTTTIGTITFAGACTVDDTITITDAAGTTRVFTAKGSTTAGSLQFINTDAAAAATALKLCIDNAAGFGTNSITVADSGAGVLTLTLLVNATYRFKKKSSIQLMTGINANVTSVDFAGGAAAEDIDGHTIAGGGNSAAPTLTATNGGWGSKTNNKSNIDVVKGIKSSGSKVIAKTGTATKPGVALARSGGTLAYNPQGRSVTLSTSNIGWLMRGGTATLISGIASTANVLQIPGSDSTSRFAGSVHEMRHYRRQGAWSDTVLDLYNGKVYDADGNAKSTISGWGTKVELNGIDGAAYDNQPTRAIPGELVSLHNFVSYSSNMVDYSALNG